MDQAEIQRREALEETVELSEVELVLQRFEECADQMIRGWMPGQRSKIGKATASAARSNALMIRALCKDIRKGTSDD